MHTVYLYASESDAINNLNAITIHSNSTKLIEWVLVQKQNGIDTLEFSISINNKGFNAIIPKKSVVKMFDEKGNKIFHGRILKPKNQMDETGFFKKTFVCESRLGYLYDSIQRYKEVHNISVADFFSFLIATHNSIVDQSKRFKVGKVTVTNTTDNVYRFVGYESTYETIKDKLIDRIGGYLNLREETDGIYIDYLESIGEVVENTKIAIGLNQKSVTFTSETDQIITRLFPSGEIIEKEDDSNSNERVSISSVNNGIDYVEDVELQKVYGIIEGTKNWDDVSLPQNLLNKAKDYLTNQKVSGQFEINAVELSKININIEELKVNNFYWFQNDNVANGQYIQIIEKTISSLEEHNPTFVFGVKKKSMTAIQKDVMKTTSVIYNNLQNQNARFSTLNNELSKINNNVTILKKDVENINDNVENINNSYISQNNVGDIVLTTKNKTYTLVVNDNGFCVYKGNNLTNENIILKSTISENILNGKFILNNKDLTDKLSKL